MRGRVAATRVLAFLVLFLLVLARHLVQHGPKGSVVLDFKTNSSTLTNRFSFRQRIKKHEFFCLFRQRNESLL